MNTILVTGGAGFIGSNLCESLLEEGNHVIILDNFNTYYDPSIKRRNIDEVKKTMNNRCIDNSRLTVFEGDIRDKKVLDNIFNNKIDIIIHLAAMAGVRNSISDPELYYDVNLNGTLNLLNYCVKHKVKRFVFASSSSVYGNNKKVPFSEEDFVDRPISPYAATKKAGELLCHTYHHLYGISIACLRFFTVYGPRQRPDLAIHKFTDLISKGDAIPFYGDGSTARDYTYIDDIILGIRKTISWLNNTETKFDVFNIGGDKVVTLNDMVKTIEDALNKKAKLNLLPMQAGDVNMTCSDLKHSREVLGYDPVIKFDEGIKKFVSWFVNNR